MKDKTIGGLIIVAGMIISALIFANGMKLMPQYPEYPDPVDLTPLIDEITKRGMESHTWEERFYEMEDNRDSVVDALYSCQGYLTEKDLDEFLEVKEEIYND